MTVSYTHLDVYKRQIEDYVKVGNKLKLCGCDELCMCCNTAHYAIDELSEKIGIKFINLLDLVAMRCRDLEVKRVGMMCRCV